MSTFETACLREIVLLSYITSKRGVNIPKQSHSLKVIERAQKSRFLKAKITHLTITSKGDVNIPIVWCIEYWSQDPSTF